MNEHSKHPLAEVPAIGISMQHQVDDFRSIVFQGHVPADCTDREFNALLDKLRRASERQKAIAHLPTVRGLLEVKRAGLVQETATLFRVESEKDLLHASWSAGWDAAGKRGPFKPSPGQTQELAKNTAEHGKCVQNLTVLKKEIAEYERQVADLERLAADPPED